MVSTKTKTLLLMSSIAMLATPAAVGSAQATPHVSNDNATELSARRRDPSVKPRQAKTRAVKARYAKAKAHPAKANVAKASNAKPQRHHTGPQMINHEAYLDRHGIGPSSYAYMPERGATPTRNGPGQQSHDRAAVRPQTRTARRSREQAPEQPHQWGATSVVAEARRYIGTNPTRYTSLWCADFINLVLERTGYRGTRSRLARSFASYGTRVAGPQVGSIAVMSRRGPAAGGGPGGHVGVVSGVDPNGNPIIISGNHNKRVAEAVYPRARIYAYVMPN